MTRISLRAQRPSPWRVLGNALRPRRTSRRACFRPALERMEGRALLATLNVGAGETYATIQAAVDAASSGDTIAVDPGTYTEQVTIPDGLDDLTLKSTHPLAAVIQAPDTLSGSKSIVEVDGAEDLTITGFTISGPSTGILAGIHVDNGGSATIRKNHITDIQDDPFSNRQAGLGVFVEDATASIDRNLIDNYQKAGIVVDATHGPASAWITNNTVVGVGPTSVIGQNGIQVSNGASAFVSKNDVSGNVYSPQTFVASGILLFKPGSVIVDRNSIEDNDVGILVQDATGSIISQNKISDSTFDGIELRGTTNHALVIGNHSSKNQLDGIFVESTTANNLILFNHFNKNGSFDAEDLSTGSGTAGTANFWFGNHGKTDNKGGGLLDF